MGFSAFSTTTSYLLTWAFYIHEIGIGALHQALLLMFPLLLFWRGMKKILCELTEAEMYTFRNQWWTWMIENSPHRHITGRARPLSPLVSAQLGRHLIASPLPSMHGSQPASAAPVVTCPGKCGGQMRAFCDPKSAWEERADRRTRSPRKPSRRNSQACSHEEVVTAGKGRKRKSWSLNSPSRRKWR